MSLDGYIDDTTDQRLLLSNDADFGRVDAERAASDAILIGANTIRRDNPRLLVRSAARRADRVRRSLTTSPAKVTVTASGELSRDSRFFSAGAGDVARLVYCSASAASEDAAIDSRPLRRSASSMRVRPVLVTRNPAVTTGIVAATRSRRSIALSRPVQASRSLNASLSKAISGCHAQPSALARISRPGPLRPPPSRT
jgi:riboflavin biosynthesis pyrimidine reductase